MNLLCQFMLITYGINWGIVDTASRELHMLLPVHPEKNVRYQSGKVLTPDCGINIEKGVHWLSDYAADIRLLTDRCVCGGGRGRGRGSSMPSSKPLQTYAAS